MLKKRDEGTLFLSEHHFSRRAPKKICMKGGEGRGERAAYVYTIYISCLEPKTELSIIIPSAKVIFFIIKPQHPPEQCVCSSAGAEWCMHGLLVAAKPGQLNHGYAHTLFENLTDDAIC